MSSRTWIEVSLVCQRADTLLPYTLQAGAAETVTESELEELRTYAAELKPSEAHLAWLDDRGLENTSRILKLVKVERRTLTTEDITNA